MKRGGREDRARVGDLREEDTAPRWRLPSDPAARSARRAVARARTSRSAAIARTSRAVTGPCCARCCEERGASSAEVAVARRAARATDSDRGRVGRRVESAGADAPLLSVLIPVYNEIATLAKVIERVQREADRQGDPARRRRLDRRLARVAARARRARRPAAARLLPRANRGKSAALRTAIAAARGRITLIQDADLEYDPADYPTLIEPIVDGQADVVYGSRFLGNKRRVLLFWHTVGNRFLTLFSNVFTNLNLTDLETCYKAFRTELIQIDSAHAPSASASRRRSPSRSRSSAAACTRCRSRTTAASTGKARRSAGRTACRRCG